MKCTFFWFHGEYRNNAPEHAGLRAFSSALVPSADEKKALEILRTELSDYHFDIIEVKESWEFDPDQVDMNSRDEWTMQLVSLYEEVKRFNQTLFLPFHIYDRNAPDQDE